MAVHYTDSTTNTTLFYFDKHPVKVFGLETEELVYAAYTQQGKKYYGASRSAAIANLLDHEDVLLLGKTN